MKIKVFEALLVLALTAAIARSASLGIMVPAYFSPDLQPEYWSELDFGASQVPLIAIMDSNNGPGTSKTTGYVNALLQLHQAGGAVIGYIYTSQGARPLTEVESDVDTYLSWYNVDGFFFDEMASDANTTNYDYYQSIYEYVKSKGNYIVAGNSGMNTQESYISLPTVDIAMIFEGYSTNYTDWLPSTWVNDYPPTRFANLPHFVTDATTMTNDVYLAANRNAGWVFVTGATYDTMPSYWTNEVDLIQAFDNESLPPLMIDPTQPTNQMAAIGDSVTFQTSIFGSTPLFYRWFCGTNAILNATNPSYTISSFQFTNIGSYYAQISNIAGITNSRVASLTISTNPSTYRHIIIDGSFDDWVGLPPAASQAQLTNDAIQFKDLYLANDDDYLYLRFDLYVPSNPFTSHQNIFINTDGNKLTGYGANGIGSELLIQGGNGYRETNGVFNAGTVDGLNWQASPSAAADDFEVRISRHTTYTNGLPVFTNRAISLVLESAESSGNEWFPGTSGGLTYNFASAPALEPLFINFSNNVITVSWNGPGTLQSSDSLTNSQDWTNVPNVTSPCDIIPSEAQQYYRLIQ
ncbi:MAG TPA: spherulation-specific family 4 protein [Verrucomicrobiae bacterium]|jgi:hypothetical protein